jgi:hypothetical protein
MPVPLSSNVPSPGAGSAPGQPPKLLDRLRDAIRVRHYSLRTEEAYAAGVRRFILFHGKRHPWSGVGAVKPADASAGVE